MNELINEHVKEFCDSVKGLSYQEQYNILVNNKTLSFDENFICFMNISKNEPNIKKSKPKYIYIFQDINSKQYKIGITENIENRIKTISTNSGRKLSVIDYFEGNICNETNIHKELKEYNIKGEWYCNNDIVTTIFQEYKNAVISGIT